jgi:ketosteroid isomerase-like protein
MTESKGGIEHEILRLEEELRQAEMRVDAEALDGFYANDIMVTAPVGVVVDKPLVQEELRRARTARIEVFDKDDVKVRAYGETAVASYRLTVKGQNEGIEISQQFRVTDVWLRRAGRWQVVSRHTALMALPQAASSCSQQP